MCGQLSNNVGRINKQKAKASRVEVKSDLTSYKILVNMMSNKYDNKMVLENAQKEKKNKYNSCTKWSPRTHTMNPHQTETNEPNTTTDRNRTWDYDKMP